MARQLIRLASVHRFREAQLCETTAELSKIETEIQSLESARQNVDRKRVATHDLVLTRRAVTSAELRDASDYGESLEREQARIGAQVDLARRSLAAARERLVERHQAVSALRRLRERVTEAARLEDARAEQRAVDEMSGAKHYRSQLG